MPKRDRTKPYIDDGKPVTIRRAREEDAWRLEQLAALSSRPPLVGDLLVAEVEGELRAARSLHDGRSVSDPFLPTVSARELLELRARLLAPRPAASSRGRLRLRLRRV